MNKKRLLKLADFLEVLPENKFDYSSIVSGEDVPRKTFDCGSTACAVGWCPIAFPRSFKYHKTRLGINLWAQKNGRRFGDVIRLSVYLENPELESFFGLQQSEVVGLFWPGYQYRIQESHLDKDASAKDVAAMIRRFVEKKQAA